MAKNDYFVLVYKILSYLYKCLKKGREPSEEYLKPLTKDFPIEYSYWSYIMEHIVERPSKNGVSFNCIKNKCEC